MGQSLYINYDAEDLRSARVRGATDLRSQKFTQFVAGDSLELDLYLTGINGSLNIQDYPEVRLGIGNLDARPESGSYLVGGSDTLAYDHSAAELKTVIDSQVAGATVTKLADFVFKIQFDAVGAQTIPSLDFVNLQPRSTVSVTRLTTGGASTKESWLWRLFRDPLAFTNTFTNIPNDGIRGTLSLATAGIYDLIANVDQVQTFFEVELTDVSGNVRTSIQAKVKLNGEVIGHNFSGSIPTSPTNSPEANAFLESFPDPTIVGDLTVGGFDLPTGAVDGYVLTSDASGVGTWAAAAAGSGTLDSVTTNGATTTNDVVVGSIFATGNNVASGGTSLAIGGAGNTASGSNSEVIGSDGSTASSQGSTIVGGSNNDNAGTWSATLGGLNQNVATGANRSAIVAGFGHAMNHVDSVILGGSNITTDASNTVFVPSLKVDQTLRMPTGAADGYVLTSDASGVGTWEANEKVSSDTTGEAAGSNSVLNMVSLTQAEYDTALANFPATIKATTLYIIKP